MIKNKVDEVFSNATKVIINELDDGTATQIESNDISQVEKFIQALNNLCGVEAKITIELPELNYSTSVEL